MRGIEGKIEAIRFARTRNVPYFGICLGRQCAVVEFARSVLEFEDANSTEFDQNTGHPVIWMMEEQHAVRQRGGTMRLGSWPCSLAPGGKAREAYGVEQIGRTPPPSLRVQQCVSGAIRGEGIGRDRDEPRRHHRRDRRIGRSPLVRRRPVPPRVQVEAHAGTSLVPRIRRRLAPPTRDDSNGGPGSRPNRERSSSDRPAQREWPSPETRR